MTGIVALLNDFRLYRKKSPIGFFNPWLYGIGRESLTDVKLGKNEGCNSQELGFPAYEGWDPVRSTRIVTSLSTSDDPSLRRLRALEHQILARC